VAQSAVGQRRPGMGAFALKGAQMIAHPQQDNFRVRDLDFKAPVFRHIGETGDAVQCHDHSPGKRFT
jgi:hypothetical protein